MSLIDAEVLPEIDPIGPSDRRAWFALRLRPRALPEVTGVHIVLTIDRSSSMRGEKLAHATHAASVLVDMLGEGDELAILSFDEHVRIELPRHRADEAGKTAAHLVLAGLAAGHGTSLHDAAEQSFALANGMARGHAILITDGFPYCGITDAGQIVAMVGQKVGAATLTTIGVGTELDASLLAAMAGVGGGRFLHVDEGGDLVGTLGGELATLRGAVSTKMKLEIRAARGFSIRTVPHYAMVNDSEGAPSSASATLAPAVVGEQHMVPFELAWAGALDVRDHQVALVTIEVGAPGSSAREVLEVRVRLKVGATRGGMDGVVTRAVCEIVAGRALHEAAVADETAHVIDRVLADAAGWIRGRAGAAGLDPLRELGPTLHVLAIAQILFQHEVPDAPLIRACAEGLSKRYDPGIGTMKSMLDAMRTDTQTIGAAAAKRVATHRPPSE